MITCRYIYYPFSCYFISVGSFPRCVSSPSSINTFKLTYHALYNWFVVPAGIGGAGMQMAFLLVRRKREPVVMWAVQVAVGFCIWRIYLSLLSPLRRGGSTAAAVTLYGHVSVDNIQHYHIILRRKHFKLQPYQRSPDALFAGCTAHRPHSKYSVWMTIYIYSYIYIYICKWRILPTPCAWLGSPCTWFMFLLLVSSSSKQWWDTCTGKWGGFIPTKLLRTI